MKLHGGKYQILVVKNGQYVPVMCGRELSVELVSSNIEATKSTSSRWRQYISGLLSATVSFSALQEYNKDGYIHFYNAIVAGNTIKFICLHQNDASVFVSGNILLDTLSLPTSYTEVLQYSVKATVDGPLNIANPYTYNNATQQYEAAGYDPISGDLLDYGAFAMPMEIRDSPFSDAEHIEGYAPKNSTVYISLDGGATYILASGQPNGVADAWVHEENTPLAGGTIVKAYYVLGAGVSNTDTWTVPNPLAGNGLLMNGNGLTFNNNLIII